MRNAIALFGIALMLLTSSGCGIPVRTVWGVPGAYTGWNAAVIAPPSSPFIIAPGQSIVIIIQLVPINGFVLASQPFFNNFFVANPNLTLTCPNILSVAAPAIGGLGAGGLPTVLIPVAPIGIGTCLLPVNLGLSGVVVLNVSVSSSNGSQTSTAYSVKITRRR